MSNKSKFIISTIIGGAIGSVVGLLVAPEKGSEIRQKAKEFSTAHKGEIDEITTGVKKKALRIAEEIKKTIDEK